MRKFYRICGLALIVGLVMMLVGWSNNGVKPIIANHNHFTLKAIDNTKLTRTYVSNHKFNKVFVQTDSFRRFSAFRQKIPSYSYGC